MSTAGELSETCGPHNPDTMHHCSGPLAMVTPIHSFDQVTPHRSLLGLFILVYRAVWGDV